MGKVVEQVRMTNFIDKSKSVSVDALIDTGATLNVIPAVIARKLRLKKLRDSSVRYADGRVVVKPMYGIITIELKGRAAEFDAIVEENCPQVLIGQIVLERLDLFVDPVRRRVLVKPRSPDMPTLDLLSL